MKYEIIAKIIETNQIGVTVFLLYPMPKFLKVPSLLNIIAGLVKIIIINKNINITTDDKTLLDFINSIIII